MNLKLQLSLLQIFFMPSNDPLHGKTLEMILKELVHHFGWEDLGSMIRINCFTSNPSINSSLKFLRKTPWARKKVEALYIKSMT
ncbi:VF530 family protein [Agriterribacter sp.]|uniref:VF530 family protein n=1 Tax=Agriterribacter sp. TaxID=2821509 RepID=UPI002C36323F|nr:VF530 family protein [Agriterribacter sp.]HTN05575.1 VF530 family protein [Agriterribacter sp.]